MENEEEQTTTVIANSDISEREWAFNCDNNDQDMLITRLIECVDQAIVNFSDEHQHHVPCDNDYSNRICNTNDTTFSPPVETQQEQQRRRRKEFWNKQASTSANDIQELSELYAPVGLTSQFEDLYRILHPCLVVATSHRNQQSIRHRSNVSAFLQGSRGTGKTCVLNRCLQAFYDEQQYSNSNDNKIQFRLVHINGIVVPGYSVVNVVREILTQLTDVRQANTYTKAHKMNATATTSNNEKDTNNDHNALTTVHNNKKRKLSSNEKALEKKAVDELDALQCSADEPSDSGIALATDSNASNIKKHNDRLEQLLRLKQTPFSNQLQLLTEILQTASVDGVPVLFVIEELDTLLGIGSDGSSNNTTTTTSKEGGGGGLFHYSNHSMNHNNEQRQLLLYHLLDRVATAGSYCSFVGITSTSAFMGKLEKRIKSRAEGTAKFIQFGPCTSFPQLKQILLQKIYIGNVNNIGTNSIYPDKTTVLSSVKMNQHLHDMISDILSEESYNQITNGTTSTLSVPSVEEQQQKLQIYETMQRDYKLGKDLRWFSRVFYSALASYRHNLILLLLPSRTLTATDGTGELPDHSCNAKKEISFQPKYLLDALADMSGSLSTTASSMLTTTRRTPNTTPNIAYNQQQIMASNSRLQILQDLSGPQVALLLSCRRILLRECMRVGGEENSNGTNSNNTTVPLTLDRALEEYRISYKSGSARYNVRMMRKAFFDLASMGLLRPASDHTGVGPFQYHLDSSIIYNADENTMSEKMPLQLTIDVHRELTMALESNILHCSTALRGWGRKVN